MSYALSADSTVATLRVAEELRDHGVRLLDNIDGTILQETSLAGEQFDTILFNFPHAGTFEDRISSVPPSTHGALIEALFKGVKLSLTARGCLCLTLHKNQFEQWKVEQHAKNMGFYLEGDSTFDPADFPEYRPVWGDDRDFTRSFQPGQRYSHAEARLYRFVTIEAAREQKRRAKETSSGAATDAPDGKELRKPVQVAVEAAVDRVCDEGPLFFSRMLRLVEKPSLSKMEREFQARLALSEQYPLLALWLRAREDLQMAGHLMAVVDWVRFVQQNFGFKLGREDSLITTYQALQRLNDEDNTFAHDTMTQQRNLLTRAGQGARLFDRFCAAWSKGSASGCIVRLGCKELPAVRALTLESAFGFSCPDATTVMGSYVLALIQDLAAKQNQFVEDCLAVASRGDGQSARRVRSVSEYWFHQGQLYVPSIKMQHLEPMHLLNGTLQHGGSPPELGLVAGSAGALAAWEMSIRLDQMELDRPDLLVPGSTCLFDWELLEQHLAEGVLQKAVHLDAESVEHFPFAGEAFLHMYTFLAEACEHVKQEPSPDEPRQFLLDSGPADSLSKSLQAVIASVRRCCPPPELSVAEFCQQQSCSPHLYHLVSQEQCRSLQVKHLVHLFEEAELHAAEEALHQQRLARTFCADLKSPLRSMEAWHGDFAVMALDVLKRILMRFLLLDRSWKPEEEVQYFVESALRKVPTVSLDAVSGLFDGLQLQHINAAIQFARHALPYQ